MRKILIIWLLIILVLMSSILVIFGLTDKEFGVESYMNLQKLTRDLNIEIQKLQSKNTSEYEAKKQNLINASNNYNKQKNECEKLILKVQAVGGDREGTLDLYDIDFLWTIIGNYATEEGVILKFDITESVNNISFLNTDYILCDLKFSVSGKYSSIANFIYNLEDDNRLNFEIRDFTLKKDKENLLSEFIVKSIPINKINLSK